MTITTDDGVTHRLIHPSLFLAARKNHVLDYQIQYGFLGWQLEHVPSGVALSISKDEALRLIELMEHRDAASLRIVLSK